MGFHYPRNQSPGRCVSGIYIYIEREIPRVRLFFRDQEAKNERNLLFLGYAKAGSTLLPNKPMKIACNQQAHDVYKINHMALNHTSPRTTSLI